MQTGVSIILYIGMAVCILISCIMAVICFSLTKKYRLKEKKLMDQTVQMTEQERMINEMKTRLMLSQMQPHFLYNCLNSIYYLCGSDPGKAQRAVADFSDYLRANMDSLGKEGLVPFREELTHVKKYIALEKMRFERELQVKYDLESDDFEIPVLTLQPIVENAVKHGIEKRPNGGTVTITTEEQDDGILLMVQDDGVGFDVNAPYSENRTHIGIRGVRERIERLEGGQMSIKSEIGVGTTVVLKIPFRKNDISRRIVD